MIFQTGLLDVGSRVAKLDLYHTIINIGISAMKAVIIYILFLVLKNFSSRIIHGVFAQYRLRKHSSESRAKTLEGLTNNVVSYMLVFVFIVTVLQIFGIRATAILAGAGIVGLAVGFGAQGLVSDVVTGFFILLERQMDVGDYVTTGEFSGVVEQMGLRTTHIRDFDGTLHYIPNRNILNVSNHSRGNMRALVDISIPGDEELDAKMEAIEQACRELAESASEIVDGPHLLGVQSLDGTKATIRVIAKTKNGSQWDVERNLREKIKLELAANFGE